MTSFKSLISDAKCTELHRVVESEGDKFLCFTRFTSNWILCVTDGLALWKVDLDEEETDALRDLAGINTMDAFLTRFRNGFHTGDLDVAIVGNKVTVTVGKGSSKVSVDLYEAKAAEKKSEMQNVLFRLAESSTKLATDLDKANHTIDTLKAQKGTGQAQAFMDLGPKKGPNPAKAKPTKVGMSVLNPTSKKRKAAHGVVFD
ncbi:uncharacterized protein LOC123527438 [Mercenaria mercenaria]|uniref:uncharacterized protein LOC123527438 n=1 Tax=Mercenaria mercenaria TaxID=6596 RepID=UPI001E1D77B2|nr:uncharacterized protein LOC123527438 [Mercenaria mercenaria]